MHLLWFSTKMHNSWIKCYLGVTILFVMWILQNLMRRKRFLKFYDDIQHHIHQSMEAIMVYLETTPVSQKWWNAGTVLNDAVKNCFVQTVFHWVTVSIFPSEMVEIKLLTKKKYWIVAWHLARIFRNNREKITITLM